MQLNYNYIALLELMPEELQWLIFSENLYRTCVDYLSIIQINNEQSIYP
jgi:hypothetical protein